MKRLIRFSNFFIPAVIISAALITFGLIGYFTMGLNLGVDFQAGVNQTIQLAYPAASVTYEGKGNASLNVSDAAITLVFSGAEIEQKTLVLDYKTYATVGDLAKALAGLDSVKVALEPGAESLASTLMVPTYQGNTLLGPNPMVLHRAPASEQERFASTEKVRDAISSMGQASVQTINPVSSQRYLIRVQDEGKDANFTANARAATLAGLEAKFGKNMVVVLKTDFVGARYSQTLSRTAALLVLATLLLILIYSTIRFKIEYAIGAVLAILHDALILVGFVVWTRMEFNASTIAAILTILGYSINDTIVQFDRVREERKLRPNDSFKNVLDYALSVTLGRTIITTVATMLTVLSLFFFTTGDIKNFSLALFVGMVSGTYSTIYIASAFVLWWQDRAAKKGPGAKEHALKEIAGAAAKEDA